MADAEGVRCFLWLTLMTFFDAGRFEGGAPSVRSGNNSRGGRVAGEPSSVDADPLSHGNFSHAFGAAWNLLHTTVVEPVWNSGFWRHIFGSDSLGFNCEQNFKRPRPSSFITDVSEPVVESHKKQCLQGFALGSQPPVRCCVKSTDDVTWQEHREAQLPEATKHWLVSFLSWSDAVEFVQCISCCDSVDARLIMLGDVFRGKAPGILTMMANSLKNFCEQLERDGLSFPCIETSLHGVLRELRRQGMLATRAKGIMETIAFVRYAMGVLECDALLRGKRCWKAATVDFSAQRNRVSPLHAKELVKLHSVLESISDVWERIFRGTVLFVVCSRTSWSDAQHEAIIIFEEDCGVIQFVEVVTSLHKTMRDFQHRHQFLQLVVPAVGVSHQNWGVLWKQVRDELCIDFAQGHALMPAPLEDGTPGRRAWDSQETGNDEDEIGARALVEESIQNLDFPDVIPETWGEAVNDACTETSSIDASDLGDERSRSSAMAVASSNLRCTSRVHDVVTHPVKDFSSL